MPRSSNPRLTLARLVRRADARRAAALAAALAVTAAPALAQGPFPQGPEFQVNLIGSALYTTSVAMDADGDFVVAWTSLGQDGSQSGVHARRYAASGTPLGPEFQVNSYTTGLQERPSVAMDADGDFVVVWQSADQDAESWDVYAQRYSTAGTPVGGEFRVSTYSTSRQERPSVAMDAEGDFVVAWQSFQDGSGYGVYVQRYSAAGAPRGGEVRVNQYTTNFQRYPSVATDADGDFVVAWTSVGQDGSDYGVFARRYSAVGTPQGGEFQVNTTTTGRQEQAAVAMDADGDVVVVWQSRMLPTSFFDVYAQEYSASGVPVGGQFRIDDLTGRDQGEPSVAMAPDGDFVVTWERLNAGAAGNDVYAARYDVSGGGLEDQFLVNTHTTGSQEAPSVAMDADGDVVFAWLGSGPSGAGFGVQARRYGPNPVADEPGAAETGLALTLAPSPVGPAGGTVRYTLPEAGRVRLAVYDVLGREVAVLADGEQSSGPHDVALDAGRLAPGVYVVRLEAGAASAVRRVTVAR